MKFIELFFPAHLAEALGWMVLHSLWQVVAAAFLAAIALITLRNRPAMIRYRVANLALATVLVAAVCTFFYYYDAPPAPMEPVLEMQAQVARSLPLPSQILESQLNPAEPAQTSLLDAATWQAYFSPHLPWRGKIPPPPNCRKSQRNLRQQRTPLVRNRTRFLLAHFYTHRQASDF